MTEEIPNRMDIGIEEDDVQQNLISILDSMNVIRKEQIREKDIPNKRKDEYLHLAYRLASMIEGLSDNSIKEKIGKVVECLAKNKALLNYDYLQDKFWRKTEPEFNETLDQILIHLQKDNFSDLEEKYHLLQAIKYLYSADKEKKEKINVYNTINPFTDNSSEYNQEIFKKQVDKIGARRIEEVKGLTLKVKDSKNLEEILDVAGNIGFSDLQVLMSIKEYEEKWKGKHPGSRITMPRYVEKEVSERKKKIAGLLRKSISITFPISGYIIGELPESLVKKMDDYFRRNEQPDMAKFCERACMYTLILEFITGFVGIVGSGALANPSILPAMALGVYLLGNSVVRLIKTDQREGRGGGTRAFWREARTIPSLHGALIGLPFWLYYKSKGELPQEHSCVVNFPLHNDRKKISNNKKRNFYSMLEELGKKNVAENEENLVWSLENHHAFGEDFHQELLKGKKTVFQQFKKYKDRDNDAWNFYDITETGHYKKFSILTCFKDLRYAIVYITESEETDFQKLNETLEKKDLTEKGLKDLADMLNSKYLHISKFEKEIKTDDYTLIK